MPRSAWLVSLGALAMVAAGCGQPTAPPAVRYYLRSGHELAQVRRAVLIQLDDAREHPQLAREISLALAQAVQDNEGFTVRVVRPDDPICQGLPLAKPEGLSLEDLEALQERLQCDAILYGRLKHFRGYPRMRMGLLLNLVDLRGGELLWQVSHIWDSTSEPTRERLQWFYRQVQPDGKGPGDWEMALMSPRAYAKFVAWDAARTLRQPSPNGRVAPAAMARGD